MPKGSVLVVDDDKDIAQVLSVILEEEGYAVRKAYSGHEALQVVSQNLPDLILMDYMLPDINGDEVAVAIRKTRGKQAVPMILISAAHNAEKIAQDAAFDGYIPKPFEIEKLLQVIDRHLLS